GERAVWQAPQTSGGETGDFRYWHYGDIVLCLVGIPLVAPKRTWSGNTRRSGFAHLGHCISPEPQPRRIAVSAAHLVKTHAAWHIDEPAFLRRLYSTFWPCHDPILGLEPASRRRRRPRLVRYCDPARRRLRYVCLRHARRRVFRLWRARGPDVGLRRRRDLHAARRQDADSLRPARHDHLLHRVVAVF